MYDYLVGGETNFEIDRQAAEHALSADPQGIEIARADVRANRAFLDQTVRYLARHVGVRQFLDLGSGIPTATPTASWPRLPRRSTSASPSR